MAGYKNKYVSVLVVTLHVFTCKHQKIFFLIKGQHYQTKLKKSDKEY